MLKQRLQQADSEIAAMRDNTERLQEKLRDQKKKEARERQEMI